MQRKYVILLHVLVWGLLIVSHTAVNYSNNLFASYQHEAAGAGLFAKYLVIELGFTLVSAVGFYGSYFLVAPRLLTRRRYAAALGYTLLVALAIVATRYLVEYRFFLPVLHFDNYRGHVWPVRRYVENALLFYMPGYFVYGIICYLLVGWYAQQQQQQELTREKLATELAYLRAQVNPHFLFNTLNDIYSLSYQKSDLAPLALLKLSELLRYMLREGQQDIMPLRSEADYLSNMIELQRISAKGSACINFKTEGFIDGQPVAALLFIAFVENAFKHGVLHDAAHPVQIRLSATGHRVDFSVWNRKNTYQKDSTGGIGLSNIRRRLELMYPGQHELNICDEADAFAVQLTLNLLPDEIALPYRG